MVHSNGFLPRYCEELSRALVYVVVVFLHVRRIVEYQSISVCLYGFDALEEEEGLPEADARRMLGEQSHSGHLA
jgi:hypothetical protein